MNKKGSLFNRYYREKIKYNLKQLIVKYFYDARNNNLIQKLIQNEMTLIESQYIMLSVNKYKMRE